MIVRAKRQKARLSAGEISSLGPCCFLGHIPLRLPLTSYYWSLTPQCSGEAVTAVGIWKLFGTQAENWYLGLFPLTAFGIHDCCAHNVKQLSPSCRRLTKQLIASHNATWDRNYACNASSCKFQYLPLNMVSQLMGEQQRSSASYYCYFVTMFRPALHTECSLVR